jgi:malonyl-CoA/methylmalonyl-CoA synthetase
MNSNLFSRLFDDLDDAGRLAIETRDGRRITYGDLIAFSGRLANVLTARGVKPGNRVAVQVEKSVANLALYLASLRAGAVYLPLNPAYTLNELGYFIADAEPALVVCDPSMAADIQQIAAKVGARVETLGAGGKGSLTEAAMAAKAEFITVARTSDGSASMMKKSSSLSV